MERRKPLAGHFKAAQNLAAGSAMTETAVADIMSLQSMEGALRDPAPCSSRAPHPPRLPYPAAPQVTYLPLPRHQVNLQQPLRQRFPLYLTPAPLLKAPRQPPTPSAPPI